MDFTAVILHKGELAHYIVSQKEETRFSAQLLSYGGDSGSSPPQQVNFEKIGRHCVGNIVDVGLMDDLFYAVKEKFLQMKK